MNFPLGLRHSWREQLRRLVQTLHDWPWMDTLKTLRQRFREDRLGLTASSLTFTTTIALVPFFTVTLAVFTAFPIFSRFQISVEKYFVQSLIPDTIAKPVLKALTQFAANSNRLGTLGLIILMFTALALLLTIDRTLNSIWRVRKARPIAQRVLVYWAAATLGPLLLGVSLSMTSYALSTSRGLVDALPGGVSFLLNVLEFTLFAGAIAALFHFVPNTHVRWSHAWAGGLFVAVGFEVAKSLLAWYVRRVPTYSAVYGTFATVPIFLVWVYFGWVIVLLGAVVAAYAPSLQMRVVRRPSTPGHRFHLAVTVLRELLQARSQNYHGLSIATLAEMLRTDPLQIEPVLETLMSLDWVARLEEQSGAGARYVLLADPGRTTAQPLLAQLLLDPSPTLRGFWERAGFARMTLDDLLKA
ncbi:YihY family inner membrane protein [Aquabacterium sp. A7-Y]|uniref:YihY family inner membrane protein n=1 Tax=Aquabacterium sp. A7-Y TaxID=1349605 RepID=UPI00223D72DF|nr:YihY family inner membrane protein [Aquabacterium sp. A7-Y]MCW7538132.1 YihY family inner membrane protein [Aquabacterium sp. A7-Y]